MGVSGNPGLTKAQQEMEIAKSAFIFPGQGSQFVGMAKELHEDLPAVRDLYTTAGEILGYDLARVCFDGPEDELKQTRVTQPAIFVHSVALARLIDQTDLLPAAVAGHSLGEYSALFQAGVFSFEDGLRLVKVRAELMQQAGEINPGTMAAVMGLDADTLNSVCEEASAAGVVCVANFNSPVQIVISGSVSGVEKAMALCSERGAKRVVPLTVGGAFHSPLMEFAHGGLSEAVSSAAVQDAAVPVYANVTARPTQASADIKRLLVEQLTSPVRWVEIINNMIADGVTEFYEVGPGSVLTGLLRRISREVTGKALSDRAGIEALSTA